MLDSKRWKLIPDSGSERAIARRRLERKPYSSLEGNTFKKGAHVLSRPKGSYYEHKAPKKLG